VATLIVLLACAPDPEPANPPMETSDTAVTPPVGRFGFPIAERERIDALVGVDHDPVVQTSVIGAGLCDDYLGRPFPHCYDEHDGSDFMLDGGFPAMDAGSPDILAAEDGAVVEAHDGEYDRCHIEGTGISCDGNSGVANYVIVEHADGLVTLYAHNRDVRVKTGQKVRNGQVVATVGDSGKTSGPHLHFEVRRDGVPVDPLSLLGLVPAADATKASPALSAQR